VILFMQIVTVELLAYLVVWRLANAIEKPKKVEHTIVIHELKFHATIKPGTIP
jgi:hypothetical protein